MYRLNAIPIKIPVGFPVEIHTLILRFKWKNKGYKTAKTSLRRIKLDIYN